MNTKELIMAASGPDKDGRTKSAIGVFREIWGADGSVTPVEDMSMDKPVVNIFRHGGYVQVDLKFGSKMDVDLRMLWSMLEKFCEAANSVEDEAESIPALTLSILPHQFEGEYYMLGVNPIFHTLQPDSPSEEPTVIRMIFDEQDFLFYEMDKDAAADMESEIKKELQVEQEAEDAYYENLLG